MQWIGVLNCIGEQTSGARSSVLSMSQTSASSRISDDAG